MSNIQVLMVRGFNSYIVKYFEHMAASGTGSLVLVDDRTADRSIYHRSIRMNPEV